MTAIESTDARSVRICGDISFFGEPFIFSELTILGKAPALGKTMSGEFSICAQKDSLPGRGQSHREKMDGSAEDV
jgi:hypothetical protein